MTTPSATTTASATGTREARAAARRPAPVRRAENGVRERPVSASVTARACHTPRSRRRGHSQRERHERANSHPHRGTGPVRIRRRDAALLQPPLADRRHRLQAHLPRDGARLRLVAAAAADAVRGALPRLHEDLPLRRRGAALPRVPADEPDAVQLLPRGDRPLRGRGPQAGDDRAQDAVPAPRHPAVGGADVVLQPLPQPDRRLRLHPRHRGRAALDVAALPADRARLRHPRRRRRDDPVRALSPLPRRQADLGGAGDAAVLRHTGALSGEPRVRRRGSRSSCWSIRWRRCSSRRTSGCSTPTPPAWSTPPGASGDGSGRGWSSSRLCVFAVWVFNRQAPRIAEEL